MRNNNIIKSGTESGTECGTEDPLRTKHILYSSKHESALSNNCLCEKNSLFCEMWFNIIGLIHTCSELFRRYFYLRL